MPQFLCMASLRKGKNMVYLSIGMLASFSLGVSFAFLFNCFEQLKQSSIKVESVAILSHFNLVTVTLQRVYSNLLRMITKALPSSPAQHIPSVKFLSFFCLYPTNFKKNSSPETSASLISVVRQVFITLVWWRPLYTWREASNKYALPPLLIRLGQSNWIICEL